MSGLLHAGLMCELLLPCLCLWVSVVNQAVMSEISRISDGHPDAHAARLHITTALLDAPWSVRQAGRR